jgi:hypothetical protein
VRGDGAGSTECPAPYSSLAAYRQGEERVGDLPDSKRGAHKWVCGTFATVVGMQYLH